MTIIGVVLIVFGLWQTYDFVKGFKKQRDLVFVDYVLSEIKQSYGLRIAISTLSAYLLGVLLLIGYFND